ncbi:MAG: colanic acid biosynthesis glycosyltransferase WcaI [Alteromonadaceae bacterium]|nr:colanic acid biosynthesis glycosyltransferase WcaI [Alteromonadaceae bacterium]
MKILLYSINYFPEKTGIGKYNHDFAEYLFSKGHDIAVLTANPYYPDWKVFDDYSANKYSVEYISGIKVQRCPLYVPRKLSTLKRLLHLLSFSLSSSVKLFSLLRKKPDFIFIVQPTLFTVPFSLLYSKIFSVKTIMHVQDFEVDALFGLRKSKSFTRKFVEALEMALISKINFFSTISYSMIDKLVAKGIDRERIQYLPNWADISNISPEADFQAFKKNLSYSSSDTILLYSGNIGEKQGLENLVYAADKLKYSSNLKFMVVGNGANLENLKNLADSLNLTNIRFYPLFDWEDVPKLLAMADIHVVLQRAGAADAVLPSKLTNILAAGGQAIVTCEKDTELGIIENSNPGIYKVIPPESVKDLVQAISYFKDKDKTVNNTARAYAIQNLDRDVIINRFLSFLESKLKERKL